MDVVLFGDDRQRLESIWDHTEVELRLLEIMLNRFNPQSEVSKVNNNAQFSAVGLSDDLWRIMLDCRRYFEGTDGFFDITWKDFEKIVFMEESKSIMFNKSGMILDFGAYAKGYALKNVRKRLETAGIRRALINFGSSSVLAMGAHPHGDSWSVGIEDPANGATLMTVHMCDTSLSVSGNTPSRPLHIMNPKTSSLIAGDQMVAIVADDPVDAEVLTTAWMASGNEILPDWILKFNLKNTYRLK